MKKNIDSMFKVFIPRILTLNEHDTDFKMLAANSIIINMQVKKRLE